MLVRVRMLLQEHGMSTEESYMFETAESAARAAEKKKKKEKNKNTFGWAAFNQDAMYKSYKKRLDKLPTNGRKEEEGEEGGGETPAGAGGAVTTVSVMGSLADNPMNYGRVGTEVSEEALERMVKELADREQARKKFSRRRAFLEGADVDYINEANLKFNKKIKKAFDKYTVEIKQNLERGTAL